MDNRGRIDEILKEGPRVPLPAGKATPETVVQPDALTQDETPLRAGDRGHYQAFTDCEATASNRAVKEDKRDCIDFSIITPNCTYDNPYNTYLGAEYYPDEGALHIERTTCQFVIEGRNLEPIRKALKRRTLLTMTQFNPDKHHLPPGTTTVITAVYKKKA